jgi:hypothetical protein
MLLALPATGLPATINLDSGVKLGDLWCFQSINDKNAYYWLPSRARLATDDRGGPIFSFVAYTLDEQPKEVQARAITRAMGGGVLHFVVEYGNSQSDLRIAEAQLKRRVRNQEARLTGPVLFEHGQYMLVSSLLTQKGKARALLKSGRAPVIAGNRIAMSFQMDLDQAELLMRNFESAAPDVSLVFDMTFSGYVEGFDAELIVDWDKIRILDERHSRSSFLFTSSEVHNYLDDLRENYAFKLKVRGADKRQDPLIDYVYQKLADLLFQPAAPAQFSGGGRSFNLMEFLVPGFHGFGSSSTHIRRKFVRKGKSVFNLSRKELSERYATIVWNLGKFHERYGNNPRHFRIVNLGDNAFKLRHVRVIVDAELVPEFDHTLNLVTVSIKKKHGDGHVTQEEIVIDKTRAASNSKPPVVVYPWRGDKSVESWLRYAYRFNFNFQGGGSYQTDWLETDAAGINVYTPYKRQKVSIVGDASKLGQYGIRAIDITLVYPFFGQVRKTESAFMTDTFSGQEKVGIILPRDKTKFAYHLRFHRAGEPVINRKGIWQGSIIFLDDILMTGAINKNK